MPFLTPDLPDLGAYENFVKFWQRIEPQSRSNDITRSLQAQIRDPLWLLTRQWQTGEFAAEDAGSPILTSLMTTTSRITRYHTQGMTKPYVDVPQDLPLEMIVERESVRQVDTSMGWRLRVQSGQQFVRELEKQGFEREVIGQILILFLNPDVAGIGRENLDDPNLDGKSRDFLLPIIGLSNTDDGCKAIDGLKLLAMNLEDVETLLVGTEHDPELVYGTISNLRSWLDELYSQPTDSSDNPWQSRRMEYEFSVSAPVTEEDRNIQRVLVSREYDGSDLDWFDFSLLPTNSPTLGDPNIETENEENLPLSTPEPIKSIPTLLSFYGCPNHRWWRFEDAKTDFGALTLDKVDLGKLLVMDFALIQGNDWFVIPFDMEIGEMKRIDSLQVTNVFDEVTAINPVRQTGNDIGLNVWDLFGISIESDRSSRQVNPCSSQQTDSFFFVPPTLGDKDENYPVEEVRFLRDEIANMVWGVEFKIRNSLGEPVSGYEAYRERLTRLSVYEYKAAVTALNVIAVALSEAIEIEIQNQISVIALREGIAIPDGATLNEILVYIGGLEEGTAGVDEIIQVIESSTLSNNQDALSVASDAAENMNWALTPESTISFAKVVIESMIELSIPSDSNPDLVYQIQTAIDETKARAATLRMKEFMDDKGPNLYYRLASIVPENWIPYVAVRQQEHERSVNLIQAMMLRNDPIAPIVGIPPRTLLLSTTPTVNEETVSRAGVKTNLNFQRTRWVDGSTHLWIGRTVTPGRGEGSSGLKFDFIEME